MSQSLLDLLPGIPVPVESMTGMLAGMWAPDPGAAGDAPSAFRASQMNLVLHFGLDTPPTEALETFEVAVRFAQRYPCRIVVLAPLEGRAREAGILTAKLFSQCFIGASHREMCCCEALIIGYSVREPGIHLENQVSIWLESDLPTYLWFHRVPAAKVSERYLGLARNVRRVVYDGSCPGADLAAVDWPHERVRDLAWARTLPVRQSLGQFLSGRPPEVLVDHLSSVAVRHSDEFRGEASALGRWMGGCINACLSQVGAPERRIPVTVEPLEASSRFTLEVEWTYASRRTFRWGQQVRSGTAELDADFGAGRLSWPMQVRFLPPEQALAEALFFA